MTLWQKLGGLWREIWWFVLVCLWMMFWSIHSRFVVLFSNLCLHINLYVTLIYTNYVIEIQKPRMIWALFCKALGNVLLSHGRTTLSSAMTRFTVLFEMGRSGSKSLMSPSNSFCIYSWFKALLLYSFYFCILVLTRWILLDIYSYCIDFIRY